MLSKVISKLIDIAMASLLYFGLFAGNEYARNIFWATIVVFVVLIVFVLLILLIDDVREKIVETRKPRGKLEYCYSITFDAAFSVALAASGFVVTAALLFLLNGILHLTVNSIDNEIKAENK